MASNPSSSETSTRVTLPDQFFESEIPHPSFGPTKQFLFSSIVPGLAIKDIPDELDSIIEENLGDTDDDEDAELQATMASFSRKTRPSRPYVMSPSENLGDRTRTVRTTRARADLPKKFWRVKAQQKPSVRSITAGQLAESVDTTKRVHERMVTSHLALETLEMEYKVELDSLQQEMNELTQIVEEQAKSMTPEQQRYLRQWLDTSPFVLENHK